MLLSIESIVWAKINTDYKKTLDGVYYIMMLLSQISFQKQKKNTSNPTNLHWSYIMFYTQKRQLQREKSGSVCNTQRKDSSFYMQQHRPGSLAATAGLSISLVFWFLLQDVSLHSTWSFFQETRYLHYLFHHIHSMLYINLSFRIVFVFSRLKDLTFKANSSKHCSTFCRVLALHSRNMQLSSFAKAIPSSLLTPLSDSCNHAFHHVNYQVTKQCFGKKLSVFDCNSLYRLCSQRASLHILGLWNKAQSPYPTHLLSL